MELKGEIARISLITDCFICKTSYKNPKLLPCGHTFCLKCIKRGITSVSTTCGSGAKEETDHSEELYNVMVVRKAGVKPAALQGRNKQKSEEKMPCQICRKRFLVPLGGLKNLPQNVFVENMVAITKISQSTDMSSTTDKKAVWIDVIIIFKL